MKVRANLKAVILDPSQIPVLDDAVKRIIEEAARIWIRAALEKVPVWSGASRATFQALATAVNEHIDIDVRLDAPDRIGFGRLYSRGGVDRLGQANWRFYYETNIRYMAANETKVVAPRTEGLRGKLIEPTPWEFRDAGNRAVEAYLKNVQLPILPLKGKPI